MQLAMLRSSRVEAAPAHANLSRHGNRQVERSVERRRASAFPALGGDREPGCGSRRRIDMARPWHGLQGPRQAIGDRNVEGIDIDLSANARIACERPGDVEVEAEDCRRRPTLHELGVLAPDANVARKAASWIEPDRTA